MDTQKLYLVGAGLAYALPIAVASIILYTSLGLRVVPTESMVTLQTSAVSSVFEVIVGVLYVAFFWIVVASIIAGGIQMSSAQARPILTLFGLPIPQSTPEQGFRTMWTAVMAWLITNALIQSLFPGVSLPSPVSIFLSVSLGVSTIGAVGTIVGGALLIAVDVPLIISVIGVGERLVEI